MKRKKDWDSCVGNLVSIKITTKEKNGYFVNISGKAIILFTRVKLEPKKSAIPQNDLGYKQAN